jgi:hypothetical protein
MERKAITEMQRLTVLDLLLKQIENNKKTDPIMYNGTGKFLILLFVQERTE